MLTRVGLPVETSAEPLGPDAERPTLICFSHLRWDFVFQRPQHLMGRFARDMDVIYWEEPVDIAAGETAFLKVSPAEGSRGVRVVVPHLPEGIDDRHREAVLERLLEAHLSTVRGSLVAWYYTPMMLNFSRHIEPDAVVYDAMDELSKFRFAPVMLLELEAELIARADLVFTGGSSLYEAKKGRHSSVHCFPSSVDRAHFGKARSGLADPADQAEFSRPRLGFYGVIDERFDIDLLGQIAALRPEWSLVMVGPVVKVSDEDLPRAANIHYLGSRTYAQLPAYLAGWDVALMPFAMNESTEFISPTKTPEYLAGGKPVVSTPVKDVVRHYGQLEGVGIASTAEEFVTACETALNLSRDREGGWLAEADLLLSAASWDTTQARMAGLIGEVLGTRQTSAQPALLVAAE
jgi:UDP-galactopyranose mutase